MVLGLRCSSRDYAYAVLDGTRANPVVVASGQVQFPKNQSRVQAAYWFYQELEGILAKHKCGGIVIRGSESRTKDKSLIERVEHESMAYPVASQRGIKLVIRKVRSTLAKDLGLKGKASYLSTKLDCSVISEFEKMPEKVQEAVICGWSEL